MDSYYDAMRRALRKPKNEPKQYWHSTCTANVVFTYTSCENISKK